MRVSPTLLNLYLDCPRAAKYYIDHVPKMVPPNAENLERGKTVHKIIETYYKRNPKGLLETEVKMTLAEIYHSMTTLHDEIIEYELLNFAKFELWRETQGFEVIGVERPYSKQFGKHELYGIVDLVMKRKNDVYVVDWKTGYQGYVTPEIQRQVSFYMDLVGTRNGLVVFLDFGTWEEVEFVPFHDEATFLTNEKDFSPNYGERCLRCVYQVRCIDPKLEL